MVETSSANRSSARADRWLRISDRNGQAVERPVQKSVASALLVDKGNHRHFMAKEIHEQPEVVAHTLANYIDIPGVYCAGLW